MLVCSSLIVIAIARCLFFLSFAITAVVVESLQMPNALVHSSAILVIGNVGREMVVAVGIDMAAS